MIAEGLTYLINFLGSLSQPIFNVIDDGTSSPCIGAKQTAGWWQLAACDSPFDASRVAVEQVLHILFCDECAGTEFPQDCDHPGQGVCLIEYFWILWCQFRGFRLEFIHLAEVLLIFGGKFLINTVQGSNR